MQGTRDQEPHLRPHPRFSPPRSKDAFSRHVEFLEKAARGRGHSGTPPGTPPPSPVPLSNKTGQISENQDTFLSQRENSRRKILDPSSNSSRKRVSRTEDLSPPPIRSEDNVPHFASSGKRRKSSSPSLDSSSSSKSLHKKDGNKKQSHSSSSDSNSVHFSSQKPSGSNILPQAQVNFVAKIKQSYDFQSKANNRCLENYSKGARRIQTRVVQHLSDIKQAVNAFNTCGVKPIDFPSELTRDLLSYNFIDIGLIYAFNMAKKRKTTVYDSDDNGIVTVKIRPIEVNHFGHWLKVIDTLRDAYVAAFPVVADHFRDYFEDLLSLTKGFSEPAEWDTICDYDIEMRQEFAARPWLTF